MAQPDTYCIRLDDGIGKLIRAYLDLGGCIYTQAVVLDDGDGNQQGVPGQPLEVSVAALPLPVGGATAANQVIMITALQLIDDLRNALVSVGADELLVQQLVHDLLNCNANIQVADVDVGAGNPVPISAAALPLPAGAATAANQTTMITALQLIDDLRNALGSVATDELRAEGPDAHDAGATTNPIQLGGVAETTRPAVVSADGDAVRAWFDRIGRLVVQIGSAESNYYANEWTANETGTVLIAAPGAGLQICIYDILVSTGTMGTVLFEEGGITRLFGRLSLAADGGWSFNSAKGVRMTANTGLTFDSTTGAGPLAITVNYAILPIL